MKASKEIRKRWHEDPKNWKLGIFYFNREDKRLFPPKRNKYLGWTVNFANPLSILTLIVLVFIVVMIGNWIEKMI